MKTLAGAIAPRNKRRSPIILPPVRSPHSNKGRSQTGGRASKRVPWLRQGTRTRENRENR
ncbi:MAG: hypothetical protein GDA43_04575 [Hormoscilla sp. SP5CHS1]|nr:hypothetical protein [Hormoscilla sp. SP5CHS1]